MTFEMPKPTEHHEKLRALTGSWSGEETMFPSAWDPQGKTAVGRLESRLDLDGLFVVTDYEQERDGRITYRGHGVYGWDAGERCYTMYWFDTMTPGGFVQPARGRFDGSQLVFESSGPPGQGGGRSRYVYDFESDGRTTFRIESSRDGTTWTPMMEGRYRRA